MFDTFIKAILGTGIEYPLLEWLYSVPCHGFCCQSFPRISQKPACTPTCVYKLYMSAQRTAGTNSSQPIIANYICSFRFHICHGFCVFLEGLCSRPKISVTATHALRCTAGIDLV